MGISVHPNRPTTRQHLKDAGRGRGFIYQQVNSRCAVSRRARTSLLRNIDEERRLRLGRIAIQCVEFETRRLCNVLIEIVAFRKIVIKGRRVRRALIERSARRDVLIKCGALVGVAIAGASVILVLLDGIIAERLSLRHVVIVDAALASCFLRDVVFEDAALASGSLKDVVIEDAALAPGSL